jgi:hypothetical protein
MSSSFAASTPWTSSQRTVPVELALTDSGRVVPIVARSRKMNTARIPAEKTTPKTGYHSKKKSVMDASRGIRGAWATYRHARAVPGPLFRASGTAYAWP